MKTSEDTHVFKLYRSNCQAYFTAIGKLFNFVIKYNSMKDFKKYYIVPAPPEEVYTALTNPLTLELWTGEPAEMSIEPGTEFSLWNGDIAGKNLEFINNEKIVQQWYFGDQPEASIVTIKLHPHKKGTSVELIHTNIPDQDFEDFAEGWDESYFDSLIAFFDEN